MAVDDLLALPVANDDLSVALQRYLCQPMALAVPVGHGAQFVNIYVLTGSVTREGIVNTQRTVFKIAAELLTCCIAHGQQENEKGKNKKPDHVDNSLLFKVVFQFLCSCSSLIVNIADNDTMLQQGDT